MKKRLDRALQEKTGLSRKKVKALLDAGRVLVKGRKVVIASWEVGPEDKIEVLDETLPFHPEADRYFLKVVYQDPHLLVVEKEAGVPCEKSPIAIRPTMVEIVNHYLKRTSGQRHPYVGPVHRLDQETSGLMVFTKSEEANRISAQFKDHAIRRSYLAVVAGRVEKPSGVIEGYLQKSPLLKGGRKVKPSTPASGHKAVTRYRVLERYEAATLVEMTLNTGRTHQIRVQMAAEGHPIIGDKIYRSLETPSPIRFPRQALHASHLGFKHPITGEKREFRSELPRDLQRLVQRLRLGGATAG